MTTTNLIINIEVACDMAQFDGRKENLEVFVKDILESYNGEAYKAIVRRIKAESVA